VAFKATQEARELYRRSLFWQLFIYLFTQGEVFTTTVLGQNITFLQGQPMITAFAKGSIKELEIIEGYKRIVTPLVGAELFSSNANEVREAADQPTSQ
jgi:hypothetical protein